MTLPLTRSPIPMSFRLRMCSDGRSEDWSFFPCLNKGTLSFFMLVLRMRIVALLSTDVHASVSTNNVTSNDDDDC